jgi:hypothetical protein
MGYVNPCRPALLAEVMAARILVGAVPTRQAGLQALAPHLNDERHHNIGMYIERTIILAIGETCRWGGGPDAVDWLLATHTAEINAAT